MRLGKIALVAAMAVSFTAQANDNVVVDLSVLESLGETFMVPNEPLFPVLPKKNKIAKPKKAKKSVAKKQPVAPRNNIPAKIEIKKVTDDVVVVDKEPAYPTSEAIAPEKPQELPAVIDNKAEAVKDVVSVQQPEVNIKASETVQEPESVQPVKSPDLTQANDANVVPATEAPVEADHQAMITPPTTAKEVVVEPEADQIGLLVEENTVKPDQQVDNSIKFANASDELSAENMAKIDAIIATFGDMSANKIAIYSYNMDDGVDSFKKKRISLNRAVEVRGYLIKQGHKNFSIKVININTDSEKLNTVELEKI